MPRYVTYLQIVLSSNSSSPQEIANELKSQGWKPIWGSYDFAWAWSPSWTAKDNEEYWNKVNAAYSTLKRLNVSYSFRTYERGKENSPVYWPE